MTITLLISAPKNSFADTPSPDILNRISLSHRRHVLTKFAAVMDTDELQTFQSSGASSSIAFRREIYLLTLSIERWDGHNHHRVYFIMFINKIFQIKCIFETWMISIKFPTFSILHMGIFVKSKVNGWSKKNIMQTEFYPHRRSNSPRVEYHPRSNILLTVVMNNSFILSL